MSFNDASFEHHNTEDVLLFKPGLQGNSAYDIKSGLSYSDRELFDVSKGE
jgi:hypothetical protein